MKKSKTRTKEKAPAIEDIIEPHPNNLRGVPLKNAYPEKAVEWSWRDLFPTTVFAKVKVKTAELNWSELSR